MDKITIRNKKIFKVNKYQQDSINKFIDTLKPESYKELSSCIVCNKRNFLQISDIDGQGIKRPTTLCRECGYFFINPQFTDQTHKDYYENFYRDIDRDFKTPSKDFYELEKYRGIDILNYIYSNKDLNKINSCLDVGCGSGATSFIFAKVFNEVIGIDLAKEYTKNVEKLDNLKIIHTTIQDNVFNNKKFDFINYCHVFEHINDPIKELKRIKEILSPNGYLYIEVPGIHSIDHWYDGNFFHSLEMDHTHFFTLNTLKNLMQQQGFELVFGDEVVRSVWRINTTSQKYLVSNESDNILSKIKKYDNFYRIQYIKIQKNISKNFSKFTKYVLKKIGIFDLIKKLYLKKKNKKFQFINGKIINK